MNLLLKRFVTGAGAVLSAKMLTALSLFAVNVLLANALSGHEVGVYLFLYNSALIVGLLTNAGFGTAAIKFIGACDPAHRYGLAVRSTFWMVVFAAVLVAFGFLILQFGVGGSLLSLPGLPFYANIFLLWCAGNALRLASFDIMVGLDRPLLAAMFSGVLSAVVTVIGSWLYMVSNGELDFSVVVWLSGITTFLVGVGGVVSIICLGEWERRANASAGLDGSAMRNPKIREYVSVGLASVLARALSSRRKELLLVVIGIVATAEVVAVLGLANQIVALVAMPMVAVSSLIMPQISRMMGRGTVRDSGREIRTLWCIGALPVFFISGALLIFGDYFVELAYGPEFYAVGGVLTILLIGRVISTFAGPTNQFLLLGGRQWFVASLSLFEMLPLVFGGAVLTWFYGAYGAAWAFSLTTAISSLIFTVYIKRVFRIWLFAWIFPGSIKDRDILVTETMQNSQRSAGVR